jgi:hypothetical protein
VAPDDDDRGYVITDLPAAVLGPALRRGANDDSKLTNPPGYLVLDMTRPATVYVALDCRGDRKWWPGRFIQGFTRTDTTVKTNDVALTVFEEQTPAGTIYLGPNAGVAGKHSLTCATVGADRG